MYVSMQCLWWLWFNNLYLFCRRYHSRLTPKNTKTTEDLELEKIEQLKWEIKQKKELSKQSFKRMKQGTPTRTMKLATKTTEPVGFNFRTDARLKPSREGARTTDKAEDKFPMNLRSSHKNDFNPNDPGDVSTMQKSLFTQ